MTAVGVTEPSPKARFPRIDPGFGEEFGWNRRARGAVTLWFRGHLHRSTPEDLADGLAKDGCTDIAARLAALDGHFALVAEGPGWVLAAVDRVRAYPLLWARHGDAIAIDHEGSRLVARLGLGPRDIEPEQAAAFALSGFTVGRATLYPAIGTLGPGEYLLALAAEEAAVHRYHRWEPWAPNDADPEDLVEPLSRLHERLIGKLIASAGGRPILVPLSAGLDSRFVAAGLAAAGYRNVRGFAYGLPGNREAVTSREIARRLGFGWTFIPYSNARIRADMATDDHARYESYADSLTAIPFPQDYTALTRMAEHGEVEPETIIVNGQSGDFITGNHVPPALFEPAVDLSMEGRRARIVEALIAKHFKHWAALMTGNRIARVKTLLVRSLCEAGGLPDDPAGDHGVYEYSEFTDRQAKYVINGQRLYEWLGLDWRLPLWDREYLDFWARAPLAAKRGQYLYRRVLERDDWGGVWRDVPVNPMRIRPGWLVPLRLALKAAHAPLGAVRWHRFEKRYLDYWMAPLCSYARWPYGRVAADRRGHYSAIGWHIEHYLGGKGLDWTGAVRTGEGHG